MKPIPKSLHTVTVLVAMARIIQASRPAYSKADCVYQALYQLGYTAEQDHYKLAEMALKQLNKGI